MRESPPSVSFAPELPLKFVGGDPSLDFVNTVDWTDEGLANDRLVDYARLIEWGARAGVIRRSMRRRLLDIARERPHAAQTAHERARRARAALHRLFASVANGTPSEAALDELNTLLRDAAQHLELAYAGRAGGVWQARSANDLDVIVWIVARAAATLLETEVARLRICAGPDCGWMYVDRSRNGLRRWCEMQTCGTFAKSQRRAARLARRTHSAARVAKRGVRSR